MLPPILWSSWEVEASQLSTRPHLDASGPLRGRAPPQQDPQLPPQPAQALLSYPRGPLKSALSPWNPPSLTQRFLSLHLCSVLHTRPLETRAWEPEEGETTASHLAGLRAPRRPAPAPLPRCSHITRPTRWKLPFPAGVTPDQTLPPSGGSALGRCAHWSRRAPWPWWCRQDDATDARTKVKRILQLPRSLATFNPCPLLALVHHPMLFL